MFPQVTGIRHWAAVDSNTVLIEVEDQVQYEAHRLAGPDRIYLDLRNTKWRTNAHLKNGSDSQPGTIPP
jgi:AMIN domain-containing protein